MRLSHESELQAYSERFEQLKLQYKPDLDREFKILNESYNENKFLLERIYDVLSPAYEKYSRKGESTKVADAQELEMLAFLIDLIDKFYADNKYLIESINQLEEKDRQSRGLENIPFVSNAISKNSLLHEIKQDSEKVERSSEDTHRQFSNLIDYINRNFPDIVK